MSKECEEIHRVARNLERHGFPFDEVKIPLNGIYLLFEEGEEGVRRKGEHSLYLCWN